MKTFLGILFFGGILGLCGYGLYSMAVGNRLRIRRALERTAVLLGMKAVEEGDDTFDTVWGAIAGDVRGVHLTVIGGTSAAQAAGAQGIPIPSIALIARLPAPLPYSMRIARRSAFERTSVATGDAAFDRLCGVESSDDARARDRLSDATLRDEIRAMLDSSVRNVTITESEIRVQNFDAKQTPTLARDLVRLATRLATPAR